ncbi:MAG: hypothetical protein IJC06_00555 [Clostridia bacterium]|nr:hypothetical protein [Clostridia bacterium]
MAIARDKFWIFGVRAHQDDGRIGVNRHERKHYQLFRSRITPTEAAHMLDVPNMLLINCDGEPAPFSEEAYGYAESFCRLDKVFWGACGSNGFRTGNEPEFICKLAEEYPNICGAFLDDLFVCSDDAEGVLKSVREGLSKSEKNLEMYVTWYPQKEKGEGVEALINKYIDGISIWTWDSKDLINLEKVFETAEKTFPGKKLFLGIYMFDFFNGRPLTDEQMEYQCELGLKWLKEGRLAGMIFEANSVMGVKFPSEKWLRKWIDKVKFTEVAD